ncbi:MAG: phage terminase small subunit P27 family [Caldilineaceae bacterium]|nr:phage terminase small subunit P27 family [Caldilineaceae bacterium]
MGGKGSGGRPLPKEIKRLRGTLRADRVNPGRVEPRAGVIRCPAGTPAKAAAVFRRLVRELEQTGILKPVDTTLLVQLATAIDLMNQAAAKLADGGAVREDEAHAGRLAKSPWFQVWRDASATVRSLSAHFGLSPSDRERISMPEAETETDEFSQLYGR